MTTIVIAHPTARYPEYSVFGVYRDSEDGYVFGVRRFTPHEGNRAEAYARWMVERHEADHVERTTNGPPDPAAPADPPAGDSGDNRG